MKVFVAYTKENVATAMGTVVADLQQNIDIIREEYKKNSNKKLLDKVYTLKLVDLVPTGDRDVFKALVIKELGTY